jgi:hypothetical protein
VSIGAELTFDRLITAVDDFGRFDARAEMLKAALFPVRADAPPELVMEWIRELANEGCVELYEVDDRSYLCLPGWEKHRGNQRRRKVSIYPDPPRGSSNASKPMPRKSGNPPEVTAGVGVGVGVGLGDGVGVEREPAASPHLDPPDLISLSDITPTGPNVNTSDTSLELVADSAVFDPLPKYLEARESATSAKPTLWRAANQLSRYPGTRSERNAWVYENEDIIVTTALASGVATETAFHAKILELLHRYYRHEFVERKPRAPRFESFEKQKRREGDAFWDNLKANGYKLTGT